MPCVKGRTERAAGKKKNAGGRRKHKVVLELPCLLSCSRRLYCFNTVIFRNNSVGGMCENAKMCVHPHDTVLLFHHQWTTERELRSGSRSTAATIAAAEVEDCY